MLLDVKFVRASPGVASLVGATVREEPADVKVPEK
jgi:hypothetical protein